MKEGRGIMDKPWSNERERFFIEGAVCGLALTMFLLTVMAWLHEHAVNLRPAPEAPQQTVSTPAPKRTARYKNSWVGPTSKMREDSPQMTTGGREGLPQVSGGIKWRPCPEHTPEDVIIIECPLIIRHEGKDVMRIDPAGPSIWIANPSPIDGIKLWKN
jgi:hypothetical protein